MAGVHITLSASLSPIARSQDTYGAMSQRDGHFSVTGMRFACSESRPPSMCTWASLKTVGQ
jgi:hypothetical protein